MRIEVTLRGLRETQPHEGCDESELETEELVLVTLDEVARLELEAVLTTIEDEFDSRSEPHEAERCR